MGSDYKGLGVADIDLADIISHHGPSVLVLPVKQCAADGVEIHVMITPKIMGEVRAVSGSEVVVITSFVIISF